MGQVADAFNAAWRDFSIAGVPATGAHDPVKSEIRSIGSLIEQLLANAGISTIYNSASDGLAATTNGEFFLVKGTTPGVFAQLFRNVSGSAVYQGIDLPSTELVEDLATSFAELATAIGASKIGTADGLNLQESIDAEMLNRAEAIDKAQSCPAPSYLLANGISAPRFDNVIDLFIVMGQSNAGGATVGPAIATAPIYPGRCLMPDVGVRITAGWNFSQPADAVETYNSSTTEGETIVTSMLSHLVQANDAVTGAAPRKVMGFVSAVGGQNFSQLKRGSFAWQNALDGCEDARAMGMASGYFVRVAGICWIQGESQTGDGTTTEQYYNMLRTLARDFGDDVAVVTGQKNRPPLFIMQTSTVSNALGLDQQVQMAQHRATNEGWARMVGPLYPYPAAANTGAQSIHKSGAGQNLMGQCFARAIHAELNGLGWQALRVRSAFMKSSTVLRVECDVPVGPLVIDTAGVVTATGLQGLYGFDVQLPDGSYATISSAAVVDGTAIELTLSSALTAKRVRVGYAMRRNAGSTDDGPVNGARGCVRDSSSSANLFGQGTLRNWLCHWTGVVENPF